MKIAVVHSFYSSRRPSGENQAVEDQVRALRSAGHEVATVARYNDDLGWSASRRAHAAFVVATGLGSSPAEDIHEFDPDVVHVHNLFPNFGRRWGRYTEHPYVHTLHNYRPICPSGTLFTNGEICSSCLDGRYLRAVWKGCYADSRLLTLPIALGQARGPVHDPLLRNADSLIYLTPLMRDVYVEAGVKFPHEIIPNFLPAKLDPGFSSASADMWLFVGNLSDEKGVVPLVRAWPRHLPLRVVGYGARLRTVREAAKDKRVEVMGRLSRSEVMELMGSSLGLVFPSRWFEGFPLVYVEALASGLPVLAFEPNGVAGLVQREGTGVAVSWSENLEAVLDDVSPEFRTMRGHCRAVYESKYTEAAVVERLTALYETVAN